MKATTLAAIVVTALVLAGGAAWASIPDASGVIHGCYPRPGAQTRALRVIDTDLGQACAADETALSWNHQGLRGTTGAQGPAGIRGPSGPRGSAGPEGQVGAGSTDAWFAHDLSSRPAITGGLDLLQLVLPAGSYVIHGKSTLANTDTSHRQGAFCEIKVGSTDLDRSDLALEEQGLFGGPNASWGTIPLRAVAVVGAPTTLVLRCSGTGVVAYQYALTAVRMGQIN